jgi:hypothetical protein
MTLRTGKFSGTEHSFLEEKFAVQPIYPTKDYDNFAKTLQRSKKSIINWFKRKRAAKRMMIKKEVQVH